MFMLMILITVEMMNVTMIMIMAVFFDLTMARAMMTMME